MIGVHGGKKYDPLCTPNCFIAPIMYIGVYGGRLK